VVLILFARRYFNSLQEIKQKAMSNRQTIEHQALEVFRANQRDKSTLASDISIPSATFSGVSYSIPTPEIKKEIVTTLQIIGKTVIHQFSSKFYFILKSQKA